MAKLMGKCYTINILQHLKCHLEIKWSLFNTSLFLICFFVKSPDRTVHIAVILISILSYPNFITHNFLIKHLENKHALKWNRLKSYKLSVYLDHQKKTLCSFLNCLLHSQKIINSFPFILWCSFATPTLFLGIVVQ